MNYIKINEDSNILVKQTNWLGDSLIALPALSALRKLLPKARITVLIKKNIASLYEASPYSDAVMPYDFEPGKRGIAQKLSLISNLKKRHFDCAILLPNSFESALWAFTARIPKRVGYSRDGRSLLLTHAVKYDKKAPISHQYEYYLNIIKQFGPAEPENEMRLVMPDKYEQSASALLDGMRGAKDAPLVAFSPTAMFGRAKEWFPDRFAELGTRLHELYGAEIVLLGTKSADKVCDEIIGKMKAPAFSLCGRTNAAELAVILKKSALFVGNDSGAAHLAGVLGVPTVVLFGSTEPGLTAPMGNAVHVVCADVECRPCFKRICPKDSFECWDAIKVDEVLDIVAKNGIL